MQLRRGHSRELPGSLPGPFASEEGTGSHITVMVMYIAPACSVYAVFAVCCFPRPRRRDYILRRRASPAAPRRTPSRFYRYRRTHMPGKRSGRKARVAVEEESEAILKHSSRKSTRAPGSTRSARSKTARVREDKGGGSSRCRRLRLACELLGWGCVRYSPLHCVFCSRNRCTRAHTELAPPVCHTASDGLRV